MKNKWLFIALILFTIGCHSESSEFYVKSGMAKYHRGDYKGAMLDYNASIKLDSNNVTAYLRRGDARVKLQVIPDMNCYCLSDSDFFPIMADYSKAVKLDSNCLEAYIKLGIEQTYWDERKSMQYFQKALKIGSKSDSVYVLIGKALLKVNGAHEEAFKAFNRAINLNPNNGEAYKERATSRPYQDHQGVLADYTEAIRINPKDGDAYTRRGIAKLFDDNKGAYSDWRKGAALGDSDAILMIKCNCN